jgi:uncharacterized protein (DUF2336 family)
VSDYNPAADVSGQDTPDRVVAHMADMLRRIAAYGFHDSRRDDLREYANTAERRYNELAAVADRDDAFAFACALPDPAVRAEIARRGYTSGLPIVVGRDAPADGADFRVWREDTAPGGWTGAPVE